MQNGDAMQKNGKSMHNRRTIRMALAAFIRACGVIDTACTIFALENRSYLGEFEAEFKKALARESGAQEELFDEKTRRLEIL
jgi:hypothetical protein